MKLLISSAKLDAEKFSDFFHSTLIFRYAVRRYPIEILHTSAPEADYLDAAIQSVNKTSVLFIYYKTNALWPIN